MARPALGRQGRTVVGSTKITAIEAETLKALNGTVHSGLRAALNAYLAQPAPAAKTAKKKEKIAVLEAVPEPVEVAPGVVQCRIHRHYKVIRRWVDRGQEWTLKRCEDCGFEQTVLDH